MTCGDRAQRASAVRATAVRGAPRDPRGGERIEARGWSISCHGVTGRNRARLAVDRAPAYPPAALPSHRRGPLVGLDQGVDGGRRRALLDRGGGPGSQRRGKLSVLAGGSARLHYADGWWRVARIHTDRLVEGLAQRYPFVRLTLEGYAHSTCVKACWNAKRWTVLDCVCARVGRNHARGYPGGVLIGADLAVYDGRYVRRTMTFVWED